MSDIRLIVCDLDGTLLNDKKIISERTISVMQSARKIGISVCLASGRNEQMMEIYEKQIGGCDYGISDNGAVVKKGSEILHCEFLEETDVFEILEYLNKREMTFMMYSAEKMFFSEGSDKLRKRIDDYEALSRKLGCVVKLKAEEFLKNAFAEHINTVAKIVAYEEDAVIMDHYKAFIESLPGVNQEVTGYGLLGAFNKAVSKKTALERIMKDMGVQKKNVCVFGDYVNDLSMFACAEHRVCMENGVQELKDAASSITLSNNEDGVAFYLERELGI